MRLRTIAGVILALTIPAAALAQATPEATPETAPPAAAPAAPRVSELRAIAGQAYVSGDHERFLQTMQQLHALRPYDGEYMYQLVLAHAMLDQKTPAYDMMLKMQQQGLSYDFNESPNSTNIRGTQVYDHVNDLMVRAGEPLGESEVAVTLPESLVLPEAIDWDESRQALLIGTVQDGLLLSVDMEGNQRELLRADNDNGMWGIFDVIADTERNRLWISSASTPMFSGNDATNNGRSAVLEFSLDDLELLNTYPVPVDGRPHALANMVLAPNGDLYVADAGLPLIYKKAADDDALSAFLAARNMVSLRGMAMSPDGRYLYVADYELGIVVVDLVGETAYDLVGPPNLNLGGIDGLYYRDGSLVMIQNGISPERIMRLTLGEDGRSVVAVLPLAVAQESFDAPTYGTVVGDDLVYFGNSHWAAAPGARQPVNILKTPLEGSAELVSPDEQKFWDEYRARKAAEAEAAEAAEAAED